MAFKKRKRAVAADELYAVVAKYLEQKGWAPLVMGGVSVRRAPGASSRNYDFVVGFFDPHTDKSEDRNSAKSVPQPENNV